MPEFEVKINGLGDVVFRHPYEDQSAFSFLNKNLNNSEVIKVFTVEFGLSVKSSVDQYKEWLVNNYEGITKIVNIYSSKYNFNVPQSVIDSLK